MTGSLLSRSQANDGQEGQDSPIQAVSPPKYALPEEDPPADIRVTVGGDSINQGSEPIIPQSTEIDYSSI